MANRVPASFAAGLEYLIPNQKVAGRFIVATDSGAAYLDVSATQRTQLKDPTKLPLTGGTMEGDLLLHGVGDSEYSAVPKSYVDSTVGNIADILASVVDGTEVVTEEETTPEDNTSGENTTE